MVVDAKLDVPLSATLVSDTAPRRAWVLCQPDADPRRRAALEAVGVRVLSVPSAGGQAGRLDLEAALVVLAGQGVRSVMVEGGARLIGSLLHRPDLVDRLVVTIAPVFVAGFNVASGFASVDHAAKTQLASAPAMDRRDGSYFHRLRGVRYDLVGGDLVVSGHL